MRVVRLLAGGWGVGAGLALALGGAVVVYAAQPSPPSHGRPSPSPSPSVKTLPSPSPTPTPKLTLPAPAASPMAGDSTKSGAGGHPCNHGFYVSQAAHKHLGGAYVSSVARSDVGKNGTCAAPLPQP